MKHILLIFPVALIAGGMALVAPAMASSMDYSTYQMELRPVAIDEARSVIDRTIGSGAVDAMRGEELLDRTRQHVLGASKEWFDTHPDISIAWGVPFYGPRNLPVAYEYYLACGDEICGSIYDVFPDATTVDDAIGLYYQGGRCLAAYDCGTGSNPWGLSLRTFFVPNAVPVSVRLAEAIPAGRLKLYHGIYAIAEVNREVVSLDPRDAGLTRKQLKKRLLGLADFGLMSPSISLITERSRSRDIWPASNGENPETTVEQSRSSEKRYACTRFDTSLTTRTIRIANGDGTFSEETVSSVQRPVWSLYAPDCVGLPLTEALLYGNHAFVGIGIDYLTGRIGSSLYQMYSRLDTPL